MLFPQQTAKFVRSYLAKTTVNARLPPSALKVAAKVKSHPVKVSILLVLTADASTLATHARTIFFAAKRVSLVPPYSINCKIKCLYTLICTRNAVINCN